ncbi:olfactomedin-like 2Ba isoform X1 [Synchiropus splendidus]|uniref:olfactomedin-like 2Ba isoform X1 n=1 Tax=Synchiropus splendidus TaxID=270530 RepID=UPI00237EE403|nr:olfactomedin-like 2Ba isoform X1 [Synchiropus splendidus]
MKCRQTMVSLLCDPRAMLHVCFAVVTLCVFFSPTSSRAEESEPRPPEEDAGDRDSILSQLLGDYDKVKVLSEGSDCRCKCVVRPLSRSACRRLHEGSAPAQDYYTVETISAGPGCKCACVAPPSAVDPCEADVRLKKLQEAASKDVKLSTVLDLLEGSFYGLDLLKLHSITSKLVGRVDHIEKVVSVNQTRNEATLTKSPSSLEETTENPSTAAPLTAPPPLQERANATGAPTTTVSDLEEVIEEKFTEDSRSSELLNASAEVKTDAAVNQKEAPQVTKPGPNGMIIRAMTFYKSDPDPMVADDGEPGENFFEYHGFSGESPLDFFMEENLLQHRAARPWVRAGPRSFRPRTTQNSKSVSQTRNTKQESMKSAGEQVSVMETTQTEAHTARSSVTGSSRASAVDGVVLDGDGDKWPLNDDPQVALSRATANDVRTTTHSKGPSTAAPTQAPTHPVTTTRKQLKEQTTRSVTSTTISPTTAAASSTLAHTTSPTEAGLTTPSASTHRSQTTALNQLSPLASPARTSSGRRYRISWEEEEVGAGLQGTDESREEGRVVKRTGECKDTLATISEPVTHNTYGRREGAWMKDPKSDSEKIYVANFYYGNNLLEFRNMEAFKSGRFTNSYKLPYNWIGTGHVVYNGAFFYNRAFSRDIIKFDLRHRHVAAWTLLHDAVIEESSSPWEWRSHSDVDFALDESGLWIIYPALDDEGFLNEVVVLSQLNPMDLSMQRETTWRTGLRRNHYGNCFVVCGVLYAVDSYDHKDAKLEYAFDTHTNTQMSPRMPFTNNYTFSTQVDYNPKDGLLYAWDNGHQVTYDVRFAYVEPK